MKKFFLAYKSRRAFEVSVAYCPEAHTLREGRGDARLASSNPKRKIYLSSSYHLIFLYYYTCYFNAFDVTYQDFSFT